MMYYGTTILEQAGLGTKVALIANIGNGLMSVIAVIVFITVLGNRVSRKKLLLTGLAGTTCTMILMSIVTSKFQGASFLPVLVITCTIIFLAFFQGCIGPLGWLLLAEIVPLRLRGLGVGIATFFLWLTNFVIGLLFPTILANFGLSGAFVVFGVLGIFGLIFTYHFVPDTRGKSLEEIETYFREYKKVS